MSDALTEHIHAGWFCCNEMKKRLAETILSGQCAIVGVHGLYDHDAAFGPYAVWCLTHRCEENAGHAFETGRVSTLD